ncbi:hypothetical protein L1987_27430 [Smallanthus sonchifolius]|uniref:Uncharacterized protein n=1 Tax=Smallanthus sonchifolius TaxID=185202 RepID=A0ACB9ICX7_9ASTR|nr:hypothetical protein L1987_27430 [Smallanthus sonchifolius]
MKIVEKLEKALELQASSKASGIVRVGTWGRQTGGHRWSFELEEDHNLRKITIDHGDVIYPLKFTSESRGVLNTPNTVGGSSGGETISEITFGHDEEIIDINGTEMACGENGEDKVSEVTFDWDEEIKAINGTVGL